MLILIAKYRIVREPEVNPHFPIKLQFKANISLDGKLYFSQLFPL